MRTHSLCLHLNQRVSQRFLCISPRLNSGWAAGRRAEGRRGICCSPSSPINQHLAPDVPQLRPVPINACQIRVSLWCLLNWDPRLHPGVWSSTPTTSQPSWPWRWAWPTPVWGTTPARPCSAGCDTTPSTSTCWRARATWWPPPTRSAGCRTPPTSADTKGGVFNSGLFRKNSSLFFVVVAAMKSVDVQSHVWIFNICGKILFFTQKFYSVLLVGRYLQARSDIMEAGRNYEKEQNLILGVALDLWKGALGLLKERSGVQNSIKCPIFFSLIKMNRGWEIISQCKSMNLMAIPITFECCWNRYDCKTNKIHFMLVNCTTDYKALRGSTDQTEYIITVVMPSWGPSSVLLNLPSSLLCCVEMIRTKQMKYLICNKRIPSVVSKKSF